MEEAALAYPPWLELPEPLAELVLERLPILDYIRFAVICPKWISIQRGHRLRHAPRPPPMGSHPLPWLLPHIYSPLEKTLRCLRYPTIPTFPVRTHCMFSSHGWLLMLDVHEYYSLKRVDDDPTRPFYRPLLYNPPTGAVISLPKLSIPPGGEQFGALSSPPYDPDCTILLVSGGSVVMRQLNDPGDGWTMGGDIEECIHSVVYHGSKFYCISRKGVLHVIDGVGSNPKLMPLTMDVSALDLLDGERYRLVEFGGELLLVVELYDWHLRREGFQVFRADLSGEKWVKKMDILADHALFLDEHCSFSLLASGLQEELHILHPRVWALCLEGFSLGYQ